MSANRQAKLKAFFDADPTDTFALYAMGLEHAAAGQWAAAADCFDRLLTLAPDHIAGYQQAGKVLIAMNHIGRARRTLTAGIARADAAGQFHARDMMRQMLAALPEND
jgi:tetratricopeptide (TPR) repeat protein